MLDEVIDEVLFILVNQLDSVDGFLDIAILLVDMALSQGLSDCFEQLFPVKKLLQKDLVQLIHHLHSKVSLAVVKIQIQADVADCFKVFLCVLNERSKLTQEKGRVEVELSENLR